MKCRVVDIWWILCKYWIWVRRKIIEPWLYSKIFRFNVFLLLLHKAIIIITLTYILKWFNYFLKIILKNFKKPIFFKSLRIQCILRYVDTPKLSVCEPHLHSALWTVCELECLLVYTPLYRRITRFEFSDSHKEIPSVFYIFTKLTGYQYFSSY